MPSAVPACVPSAPPVAVPAAQPIHLLRPPRKGRGTSWAIEHRFAADQRQAVDDGWGVLNELQQDQPPLPTQVSLQQVGSILTGNNSPDISFDVSINPYRGCEHGCIYCYARPTHSYLDLSPGLDFETRIIAKTNAAERLRETLASRSYTPLDLCIGSATDAYQPAERDLRITRSVIEVLSECRHPFSLITKSAGVLRDLDLIGPMGQQGLAAVYVSITSLDPALSRVMEPRAAAPERRLQVIRQLAAAGVPVGVSVSPVIPFINEPELEAILAAAAEAGATRAFSIPLRLPWEVSPLFQHWLSQHFPDRAARVMARVREQRGGQDNDARFGTRMQGEGVWAELRRQRFHRAVSRLGLHRERVPLDRSQFRRPSPLVPPGTMVQSALF